MKCLLFKKTVFPFVFCCTSPGTTCLFAAEHPKLDVGGEVALVLDLFYTPPLTSPQRAPLPGSGAGRQRLSLPFLGRGKSRNHRVV